MKTIKVTYTVKSGFAQKNQENIQVFMRELEKINNPDIRYIAYLGEDGKTFTHVATYQSDEAQKLLLELGSFKTFQQQRDESGLEVLPKIEAIKAVASSYSVFN